VLLTALAIWARGVDLTEAGWVHGLELAAAAVVAAAVVAMGRTLVRGLARLVLAVAAATIALLAPGPVGQTATILLAGAFGALLFRSTSSLVSLTMRFSIGRKTAIGAGVCFVALLVGFRIAAAVTSSHAVSLAAAFYRAGALVFGGGHVVLPLLNDTVVDPGWVSEQTFLAGYGAANAMPGPLFTFSAFLGASGDPAPNGVAGAAIALLAIFLPSFLLLAAALPLWGTVRERAAVQAAVAGVGAAVVGMLAAALWDPVLQTSVDDVVDAILVVGLLAMLRVLPAWAVVGIAAAGGAVVF
jgi:chromate transporter